jgi:hypothetical protein
MDFNLLLEWMSEQGSGTWSDFRAAHTWLLARPADLPISPAHHTPPPPPPPPLRTYLNLSKLGHVESSPADSRWAVAPPVLTIVPGASVHAVVVGGRTRPFSAALRAALESRDLDLDLVSRPQPTGPDTMYISCGDEADLIQLAERLGIRYEYSVSERLSQLFPHIDSLLERAGAPPPSAGYGVSRWMPESNRFEPTNRPDEPGLYQWETVGAPQYRFTAGERRYANVDFSTGRYAELRRLGINVLTYKKESVNGTLRVSVRADLPPLQARAAILCTGMLPPFERETLTLSYRNVPLAIAERIAVSLGQQFAVQEL